MIGQDGPIVALEKRSGALGQEICEHGSDQRQRWCLVYVWGPPPFPRKPVRRMWPSTLLALGLYKKV